MCARACAGRLLFQHPFDALGVCWFVACNGLCWQLGDGGGCLAAGASPRPGRGQDYNPRVGSPFRPSSSDSARHHCQTHVLRGSRSGRLGSEGVCR
jgi:hypothetical protein